jgi:hypothetical protein
MDISKTTNDWSDDDENGLTSFASSSITIRTPPRQQKGEEVNNAPKKKTSVIMMKPEGISTMRINNKSTSKSDNIHPNPINNEVNDEFSIESIVENLMTTMKRVQKMMTQDTIKKEEKRIAHNDLDQALTSLNMLNEKVKGRFTKGKAEQPEKENITLNDIMREIIEIKTKVNKPSYAQAVMNSRTSCTNSTVPPAQTTAQQNSQLEEEKKKDKARIEQTRKDIFLTTREADDDTKTKVESTEETVLANSMQQYIQQNVTTGDIVLENVKKLAKNAIRIRCRSKDDADKLREINWDGMLKGAMMETTEYGVVLHGVPKQYMENTEELMAEIERANNIKVKRVALLRKKARNPDAPTLSIVIFLYSPEEANICIDESVIINKKYHNNTVITNKTLYAADRYTPQCRVKLCYNCQEYGHKGDICKKKTTCGNCAQEHETRNCPNSELKCANCKDAHRAGYHQCPRHQKEIENMEIRRNRIPPKFTC